MPPQQQLNAQDYRE